MELQQQFDYAVNHLRTQGAVSLDKNNHRCMYRSPKGLKCAAGCFIPDEIYRSELEGKSWSTVVFELQDKLPKYLLDKQSIHLIRNLQKAHDSVLVEHLEFQEIEFDFEMIAGAFGLKYKKENTFWMIFINYWNADWI